MIAIGSRVTVSGVPGVHTVIDSAQVLYPSHPSYQIRLAPGTRYGRFHGGDTMAVESWRCAVTNLPCAADAVDLEDWERPA